MTDKQIIIDGVDVSWCKYFCLNQTGNNCLNHNQGFSMNCNNNNCYYKQLKRKEQECQQAMDNYVQLDLQRVKEYNELVDLYKTKEQECEELKRDLTDLSKIIDCKNGTILTFKEQLDQLKAENEKLKQTLAEIKEIAEDAGNTQYLTFPDFSLQINAKMLMGQFNGYLQLILQKIRKCEVENEN